MRDASLDSHPHRGWESTSTSGGASSAQRERRFKWLKLLTPEGLTINLIAKGKEPLILQPRIFSRGRFKLLKLLTPEGLTINLSLRISSRPKVRRLIYCKAINL